CRRGGTHGERAVQGHGRSQPGAGPKDAEGTPTVKKEIADDKTVRKEYREARAQDPGGDRRPKRNDVPMYAQRGPTLGELYAKLENLPEPGPERDARVAAVMHQIAQKFRD